LTHLARFEPGPFPAFPYAARGHYFQQSALSRQHSALSPPSWQCSRKTTAFPPQPPSAAINVYLESPVTGLGALLDFLQSAHAAGK
jgi:hypothetical protein